jgi:phage/plasmid-associated DNA primase
MQVKTKAERIQDAKTLADAGWIRHNEVLYMPVNSALTHDSAVPAPEDTIWIPRTISDVQRHANVHLGTLFENEKQMVDFYYTTLQQVATSNELIDSVLIRTEDGLLKLHSDGQLREPDGAFTPNTLPVPINNDPAVKAEVAATLVEWLGGSEEEAASLLRHLSTALSPHWTSIKYILLLGDGRNGKSVLLEMLTKLLGKANCSGVSRQDMAAKSTVLPELNGKLANIVMDGIAEYLKDSGTEKTLIAGEAAHVRMLYSRVLTPVQTNALFIEGLNKEPKSSDKSSALQARLVRFQFPNRYQEDWAFKAKMLSDEYVGALLSLMIDHYVRQSDASLMLAPTSRQLTLQLGHQYDNSHALQFIDYVRTHDPNKELSLIGMDLATLVSRFMSWRVAAGDIRAWDEQSVREMFHPLMEFHRKTTRLPNGGFGKVYVVQDSKGDTLQYLESMHALKEELDGGDVPAAVVED